MVVFQALPNAHTMQVFEVLLKAVELHETHILALLRSGRWEGHSHFPAVELKT